VSLKTLTTSIAALLLATGCPEEEPSTPTGDTQVTTDATQDAVGDGSTGDVPTGDTPQADGTQPDAAPDTPTVDVGGDTPSGDGTTGDAATVDVPTGDGTTGDATTGDASTGDATTGDASTSDATTGDASTGDATTGDASTGDVTTGDASTGDATTDAAVTDTAADTTTADATGDAAPTDTSSTDTGTSDVPPPADGCPAYHKFCNGTCVNVAASADNCGDCGVTCTAPEVCSAGQCKDTCLTGLSPCNGTCVNLDTDSDNCGNCGFPCPDGEGCVNGSCTPSIATGPPPAQCEGFEAPIILEGTQTCLGEQAQVEFTWGVCTCESFNAQGQFFTDAYDSSIGPYEPGQIGGGVGTNQTFTVQNDAEIGGSLFVAGTTGASSGSELEVLGEAHSAGDYTVFGSGVVGFDAFIAGDTTGPIAIGGTLYTPDTATVGSGVTYSALVTEPVSVEPPCRCGEKIPVTSIVAEYQTNNDNAIIGLDPTALSNFPGKSHLELPCGIYYLDSINTGQDLTIVATGRVALMIGGDFNAANKLQIMPAPSGELDVFIAGTLVASNNVSIGNPNFPALMRMYVGGAAPLEFNNNADIAAFIYAAYSDVSFFNNTEIFGGVIANSFDAKNSMSVHYDRGVLNAGVDCPDDDPGATCSSCADCGNQACINGSCGACVTSADCCSPLICAGGECISLSVNP